MCKRKKVVPFGTYDIMSLTFIKFRGRTPAWGGKKIIFSKTYDEF